MIAQQRRTRNGKDFSQTLPSCNSTRAMEFTYSREWVKSQDEQHDPSAYMKFEIWIIFHFSMLRQRMKQFVELFLFRCYFSFLPYSLVRLSSLLLVSETTSTVRFRWEEWDGGKGQGKFCKFIVCHINLVNIFPLLRAPQNTLQCHSQCTNSQQVSYI